MSAIFRCTSLKARYNGQNFTHTTHERNGELKSRYYTIAIARDVQHVTSITF